MVIPRGMLIDFRRRDDLGSNLIEARLKTPNKTGRSFMAKVHKGYESSGREPFTPEDIQNFLLLLKEHPLFEKYATIIIDMFGSATLDELEFVKESEDIKPPKKKIIR